MPLAQLLVLNQGGEIEVYPTERAGATPLVRIEDQGGGEILASTAATLDSVNTTITSACVRRLTFSVTLTSIVNVPVVGRKYLLGAVGRREMVTVRSVSGSTITFFDRVLYDHAAAEPFVGVRLSVSVPAGNAIAVFDHGRAFWSWTGQIGGPLITGIELRENRLQNLISLADLRRVDPKVADKIGTNEDPQGILDEAWDVALTECGGAQRVRKLWGSDAWRRYVCLVAVREFAVKNRDDLDWITLCSERATEARAAMLATRALDENDDGRIDDYEGAGLFAEIDVRRG